MQCETAFGVIVEKVGQALNFLIRHQHQIIRLFICAIV